MPYNGAARPRDGPRWSCLLTQEVEAAADVWDDFLLVCPGIRPSWATAEIRRLLLQCKRLKLGQITSSSGVRLLPPPTQSQLGREFVTS